MGLDFTFVGLKRPKKRSAMAPPGAAPVGEVSAYMSENTRACLDPTPRSVAPARAPPKCRDVTGWDQRHVSLGLQHPTTEFLCSGPLGKSSGGCGSAGIGCRDLASISSLHRRVFSRSFVRRQVPGRSEGIGHRHSLSQRGIVSSSSRVGGKRDGVVAKDGCVLENRSADTAAGAEVEAPVSSQRCLGPPRPFGLLLKQLDSSRPPPAIKPSTAGYQFGVVWLRNDLRIRDNAALLMAQSKCQYVVPVYCFDREEFSGAGSFNRIGPYRARFIIESVRALRSSLRHSGSDLIVRTGDPGQVLTDICEHLAIKSRGRPPKEEAASVAVFCLGEASRPDQQAEAKVEARISVSKHADFHRVRSSDAASSLGWFEDISAHARSNFKAFCREVTGRLNKGHNDAGLRTLGDEDATVLDRHGIVKPVPRQYRPAPAGRIPSPPGGDFVLMSHGQKLRGGEKEALRHLRKICSCTKPKAASGGNGADKYLALGRRLTSEMSPWLSVGCISSWAVLGAAGAQSNTRATADTMSELLWRDFYNLHKDG